jgi:hypothetical protein
VKQRIPFFSILTALAATFILWKAAAIIAASPILPHPEIVLASVH